MVARPGPESPRQGDAGSSSLRSSSLKSSVLTRAKGRSREPSILAESRFARRSQIVRPFDQYARRGLCAGGRRARRSPFLRLVQDRAAVLFAFEQGAGRAAGSL